MLPARYEMKTYIQSGLVSNFRLLRRQVTPNGGRDHVEFKITDAKIIHLPTMGWTCNEAIRNA
jgi:hypothetical protein